ncbi:MAG: gluconate 2-dehydrogenase subunit 3 family protein [Anaerolineae bacterium]
MTTWQIHDNQFDFSLTHSIAASGEVVYRVLAEMEAYPEFVNELISVSREGDLYKFTARAAILTVSATIRVKETPGRAVDFELVEGPIDTLIGRWLVEPGEAAGHTKVTLSLHAETQARGEWLLRMTGRFVENKTDKLIAAFSARAEALARGEVSAPLPPVTQRGLIAWLQRLWARLFGERITLSKPITNTPITKISNLESPISFLRDEHHLQTLESLAAVIIPADDFDEGVQGLGFASVVEMRARYEAGKAELYATALEAVDRTAQHMFGQPGFVDLDAAQRVALLEAVRQNRVNGEVWGTVNPSAFFSALWEDTVFLYCTHPDTWQRIGFPGPSFEQGGYGDFDQPQKPMTHK